MKLQEDAGLQGITDGEMRRKSWHMDFLLQLSGLSSEGKMLPVTFHGREGDRFFTRPDLRIAGRVTRPRPIFVEAFTFLKSATTRTPKLTIPSPCMLYTQVGRANIDPAVYPDLDAFVEDLAAAYRAEIADLYAAGCRYLQLDDVSLAYLCDEEMRARGGRSGEDPDAQLALSVKLVRATLRDRPKDLTVCTHLCRGNFRSAWRAQGGYAGIAETIFNQLPYDGFFLEFDDARSGDFSPLRHVPKHVRVVLGLVTSKVGDPREEGRPQAAPRRGVQVHRARPALRQPPVRLLLDRRGQRRDRRGRAGEALALRRAGARGVGRPCSPPTTLSPVRGRGQGEGGGPVSRRRAIARSGWSCR